MLRFVLRKFYVRSHIFAVRNKTGIIARVIDRRVNLVEKFVVIKGLIFFIFIIVKLFFTAAVLIVRIKVKVKLIVVLNF